LQLTNVKNVCRRSKGIASFSTLAMVSGTLDELDAAASPENP